MNSDRGGCRHEDCRLPLDRNFAPTPPAEPSVVGSCGSATATPNFSIRNAAASLTPPLLASRWRARLRHALTGNHPLRFRAADAEPWLSELRPAQQPHKRHAPPTHKRKPPPASASPRPPFHQASATRPHPRPRCADSRCTDSTMAQCQPLHSLRVLSVEVNATPPPHTYRPVLGALRCVEKCSPASGGAQLLRLTTPSSLRSFDPAPPCRAASSSPHIAVIPPLALINPRRGRAVACECIKIHPADFDTHASH